MRNKSIGVVVGGIFLLGGILVFFQNCAAEFNQQAYQRDLSSNSSCILGELTLEHGADINVYTTSTVPAGQTCNQIHATCNNGDFYDDTNNIVASYFQTCTADTPPADGVCGSSNNLQNLTTMPTANLCSTGNPSTVTRNETPGSSKWRWTCSGANGGSDAICSAKTIDDSSVATFNGQYEIIWVGNGKFGVNPNLCWGAHPTTGNCTFPATPAGTGRLVGMTRHSQDWDGAGFVGTITPTIGNHAIKYGGAYLIAAAGTTCYSANLATGGCTCPAGFTAQQVGMSDSWSKRGYVCWSKTAGVSALRYGGVFERVRAGGCWGTNPVTKACNCPSGYSQTSIGMTYHNKEWDGEGFICSQSP